MKCSEITKLLRENSPSHFLKQGANHELWINTETNKTFTIPRHPAKEIKKGTAEKILKQGGYRK